jgi:hypothetical protein
LKGRYDTGLAGGVKPKTDSLALSSHGTWMALQAGSDPRFAAEHGKLKESGKDRGISGNYREESSMK